MHFSRPCIDVTFQSAADAYGAGLIAVLLSGANNDVTKGFEEIRRNHGLLIAQDPSTVEVPQMPQQAINSVSINHIAAPAEIVRLIREIAERSKN